MSNVKTRFAPSPTGRMHVGNLRTALYAYLIAKHDDGTFMLRIEDTDQERFQEGALDIIYRTLKETGLVHDEGPDKDGGCGPYVQSERNAAGLYLKYAKQLVEQGDAYYCFCDAERLSQCKRNVGGKEISIYDKHCLGLSKEEVEANLAAGKPYVIRFNMPTEGTTTFHDEIYGDITVNNEELEDLILIKSDGYPTYNFANVIDDHLMGVTHVVRGNEYLSSSPKYNRIYEAFGWEVPVYVHCPLITNEEHQKLSKRCGHSSYEDLIDQGFLKDAIVNFVALLGWSPEGNREIYSLEELVKIFDYHHISKSPAVFDMTKLRWMNGEYMKAMDDEKFYEMALPYIQKTVHRPLDFKKIAAMVKTRIEVFPDIREHMRMAECHLLAQALHDICHIEFRLLFSDFGIENHMQKDVSQFFFDIFVLMLDDSITEFVNFLHSKRPQCFPGLSPVPWAFFYEFVHNIQHAAELRKFFFSSVCHCQCH